METSHPKCSLAKLRLMEPKIVPSIAGLDGPADGAAAAGGRKSLSRVETGAAVEATAALLGVKVLAADMPPFMRAHAFRCARRACDGLDRFSSRQVAHDVKKVCALGARAFIFVSGKVLRPAVNLTDMDFPLETGV